MRLASKSWKRGFLGLVWMISSIAIAQGRQAEFVVYEVHQSLSLGGTNERPPKEYYVNLGSESGVRAGDILQVSRRASTYDLLSQQFYRDVVFPIARMRVIHADLGASICRLEKFLPAESTPTVSPKAIFVGDLVQPVR